MNPIWTGHKHFYFRVSLFFFVQLVVWFFIHTTVFKYFVLRCTLILIRSSPTAFFLVFVLTSFWWFCDLGSVDSAGAPSLRSAERCWNPRAIWRSSRSQRLPRRSVSPPHRGLSNPWGCRRTKRGWGRWILCVFMTGCGGNLRSVLWIFDVWTCLYVHVHVCACVYWTQTIHSTIWGFLSFTLLHGEV